MILPEIQAILSQITSETTREEKFELFMAYITLLPLSHRKSTFRQMFAYLYELNRPHYIIVETGCARSPELNWSEDGMSTVLFDFFILLFGGSLISIDINEESIRSSISHTSTNVNYMCGDSIPILYKLRNHPQLTHIDLLYLDSYDIDWDNPHLSALHHLKELCAIQPLGAQSMVVIDDNRDTVGKGQYVAEYFAAIGLTSYFQNYQIGYIMPGPST